jgi:integrase
VLNKEEVKELFSVIDSYIPVSIHPADLRMANEYPLMFRLYYCCGMRNNEVCALKTADVDLESGILTIRDAKNHKDRLVYMPEDLRQLAKRYFDYIKRFLGYEPSWFFPGRCSDKHVSKSLIDRKFAWFWSMTASSGRCDKRPTPHCLRHTYVVDRINRWVLEGADLNVMMVYLSKYLGHKNPDESFYYYHQVAYAFQIVHQKDTVAEKVIPEVRRR